MRLCSERIDCPRCCQEERGSKKPVVVHLRERKKQLSSHFDGLQHAGYGRIPGDLVNQTVLITSGLTTNDRRIDGLQHREVRGEVLGIRDGPIPYETA